MYHESKKLWNNASFMLVRSENKSILKETSYLPISTVSRCQRENGALIKPRWFVKRGSPSLTTTPPSCAATANESSGNLTISSYTSVLTKTMQSAITISSGSDQAYR